MELMINPLDYLDYSKLVVCVYMSVLLSEFDAYIKTSTTKTEVNFMNICHCISCILAC